MSQALPSFIVPVDLKAFVINEYTTTNSKWKDMSVFYPNINELIGNKLIVENLFNDNGNDFEDDDMGIRLHWTLPSALAHGLQHKGALNFPNVPNRWLILRLQNKDGQAAQKAWVVESDFVGEDGTCDWLKLANEKYTSTSIGKVYDFEEWAESHEDRPPLTAIAPGNPTFAACFDSCENVFAFHDDLDDLNKEDAFSLAYLLVGWYSNGKLDPLNPNGKTNNELWKLRLADLQAKWGSGTTEWPAAGYQTICHASLQQVAWDNGSDKTNPIRKAATNMALGNTPLEGISARIAEQTGANERLLAAFQYDLLKSVKSVEEIRSQVEAQGFSPINGGTIWAIEATDEAKDQDGNPLANFPTQDFFDNENDFTTLQDTFNKLNADQRQLDKHIRTKNSLQVAFRAAWDRKILGATVDVKIEELSQAILSINQKITHLQANVGFENDDHFQIGAYQRTINQLLKYTERQTQDGEGHVTTEASGPYRLVRKKMPNFWQANDPNVLFSGPSVDNCQAYRTTNKNEKLTCRLAQDIIEKIGFKKQQSSETALEIKSLSGTPRYSLGAKADFPKDIAESLFYETLLLDAAWTKVIVTAYFTAQSSSYDEQLTTAITDFLNPENSGSTSPYQILGFETATDKEKYSKENISAIGKANFFNSIARFPWKAPWAPLYMLWEVAWYPDYSNGQPFSFGNWAWDGKTYKWQGQLNTTSPKTLQGHTILSDAAQEWLKSKLGDFTRKEAINYLAQALGGLSDQLLMRGQAIRLPLLEKAGDDAKLVNNYQHCESESDYFLPMLGENSDFYPIRAGHFNINQLWFVDAFGQIQQVVKWDYNNSKPIYAGSQLAALDYKTTTENIYELRPKISQAARLLFRWNSAKDDIETNSNPSTSPVHGWLLYHYINKNIWVYDNVSNALGTLIYQKDTKKLSWQTAPLIPLDSQGNVQTIEAVVKDSSLLAFLKSLVAATDCWESLRDIIEATGTSLETKGTQQQASLAQHISQPLALIKANISLETYGLPAYPQTKSTQWKESTQEQVRGMEGLKFNLSLGNQKYRKDGLIGFFKNQDFSKIHLSLNTSKPANNYFETNDLMLEMNKEPLELTLLLDTRGGVTARTGVLPEKFIDLPDDLVDKPLENMELLLNIAPVLNNAKRPYIPLANEQDNSWTWLHTDKDGKWQQQALSAELPKQLFGANRLQEGIVRLAKPTSND